MTGITELTLVTAPTGQPTTVTWDANGNKAVENAGGSLTTYTWDSENRLLGVAYPDSTIETYTYSADGLRQKSEIPMRSGKATARGTIIYVRDTSRMPPPGRHGGSLNGAVRL